MSWTRRKFNRLLASGALLAGGSRQAEAQGGSSYYNGPTSDHFDGRAFFNPGEPEWRGFGPVLEWQLTRRPEPWPDPYPSPFAGAVPRRVGSDALRVTLVGHATFLIQAGGLAILTDPTWSERASPVSFAGPRRHNPPGIAFDDLPKVDAVLLSHNHYDHLDLPTLGRLWQRDRPRIVAPLGNDAVIRAHDPAIVVTPVDWGDAVALGAERRLSVTVTAEQVHHWSARGIGDRNHALWAGYALKAGGRTLFFSGDTGFDEGRPFRRVAARHPRIDLALLPIGAYEPRAFMQNQHMNPDDAVQAMRLLGAKQALGFHWGTFQLTDEGVDQPTTDLAAALRSRRVPPKRFLALRPGQTWPAA